MAGDGGVQAAVTFGRFNRSPEQWSWSFDGSGRWNFAGAGDGFWNFRLLGFGMGWSRRPRVQVDGAPSPQWSSPASVFLGDRWHVWFFVPWIDCAVIAHHPDRLVRIEDRADGLMQFRRMTWREWIGTPYGVGDE